MTEETPKKKPRRKRRTKAEVESPKEEVQAAKEESWQKTDDIIVEMFEESVTLADPVKEDTVESVPAAQSKRDPLHGFSRFRSKMMKRRIDRGQQ